MLSQAPHSAYKWMVPSRKQNKIACFVAMTSFASPLCFAQAKRIAWDFILLQHKPSAGAMVL